MVYEGYRIKGPYENRKTGRQHMVLSREGKTTSVSFPKFLVELYLGKELEPGMTVDHINNDFRDNRLCNLRVLTKSQHNREDALTLLEEEVECPMCGTVFSLSGNRLRRAKSNRKQGKAGPFCSRRCSGRYGAAKGHGKMAKLAGTTLEGKKARGKTLEEIEPISRSEESLEDLLSEQLAPYRPGRR